MPCSPNCGKRRPSNLSTPSKFYKAYRRVEAAAFYLPPDQIEEINALRDDHWERRMAEGANLRVIEAPLRPDPAMTDEYLIDLALPMDVQLSQLFPHYLRLPSIEKR